MFCDILNSLKPQELLNLIQTVALVATLFYVAYSTAQQSRSTRLKVTPCLGAKWEIKNTDQQVSWSLIVTNYSDFPLYIRRAMHSFPDSAGFPKGLLKGDWHIPARGIAKLSTFYMSQEDFRKWDKVFGWTVSILVETSIGELWEAFFKVIGPDELEFKSITNNYFARLANSIKVARTIKKMKAPNRIYILVFVLSCISVYGGYIYGGHQKQKTLDQYFELLHFSSGATEINMNLHLLDLIEAKKYKETENLLEKFLDVRLDSISLYEPFAADHPDKDIFCALDTARKHRELHPSHKVNPILEPGVARAFKITERK